MALARRCAFVVVVLGLLVALPASASAKLEFNLPSQIFKVFDESARTELDPERCDAIVFIEFPIIKHATQNGGYRITVKDSRTGELDDYVAPPFDTIGRGFITRYPPDKGFARFFVGAYSTPDGCAAADVATDVTKIVESKVSLDSKFERRFRKVDRRRLSCDVKPGEQRVKLGSGLKLIKPRGGQVSTTEKGSRQPVRVTTSTWGRPGTIVTTGPKATVQIAGSNGISVLVASNTKVRITNDGFEVLESPKDPRLVVIKRPGKDYKVFTDCPVLSARG